MTAAERARVIVRNIAQVVTLHEEMEIRYAIQAAHDEALEAERPLREYMWLNHGCEITALYGDDGEMQCSACCLDYKRAPAEGLVERQLLHARAAIRALKGQP